MLQIIFVNAVFATKSQIFPFAGQMTTKYYFATCKARLSHLNRISSNASNHICQNKSNLCFCWSNEAKILFCLQLCKVTHHNGFSTSWSAQQKTMPTSSWSSQEYFSVYEYSKRLQVV